VDHLAAKIARFIVDGASAAIPDAAVSAAKIAVADCVGCMLAGVATEVGRIAIGLAPELRNGPMASVIGTKVLTSPTEAAMANGTTGHALDFDDLNWSLYGHPSVVVLPAILSAAQLVHASGRQIIDAFVIGVEVAGRIGRIVNPQHYQQGWHSTATIGVFGAAAASARLLGLSIEETARALSISASLSCGVRANFGSMAKPLHAGNASRAGLWAAQLARAGMTANMAALDGPNGWLSVMTSSQVPDIASVISGLGQSWEIVSPSIVLKRYPSCGGTQCAIDALLELKRRHGFTADELVRISCQLHPMAFEMLQLDLPKTGLDGKFSAAFCLALTAREGFPRLNHFTDRWVNDPEMISLMRLVETSQQPAWAAFPSDQGLPARVEIALANGTVDEAMIDVPAGDPRQPMSDSERFAKFCDCAEGVLPEASSRLAYDLLMRLEGLPSLADLFTALTRTAR
jgi:2-methylcitrate dehydratase PrpD